VIWRPYYVLGPDGEPLHVRDVLIWAAWFETADRRVALTDVGPGYVSTVFLGLDHGWGGGPPLLWETMIFNVPGVDADHRRYTSRPDAIAGHADMVAIAQLALQVNAIHG